MQWTHDGGDRRVLAMPNPLPLLLTVTGAVLYHVAQKSAGHGSPWALLTLAYAVALAVSAAFWWRAGGPAMAPVPRGGVAIAVVLGLAVLAVEAGFFFAYRAGWPISQASVINTVLATSGLLVVGAFFGEAVSMTRFAGLGLFVAGAALMARTA
jgi:drug/metabolite transporter (DMT)-like permease